MFHGVVGGGTNYFPRYYEPRIWFLPRMRKTVARPILSLASSFTRPGSSIRVDCRRQIPNNIKKKLKRKTRKIIVKTPVTCFVCSLINFFMLLSLLM